MKNRANSFNQALMKKLGTKRLFYVCRDLERAIFTQKLPSRLLIITNHTNYSKKLAAKEKNIILIKNREILDTRSLLSHPLTKKHIKKNDLVLVFKNTPSIEKIVEENDWQLVNSPAGLSELVEQKISQVKWLGPLKTWLPPTRIAKMKEIKWPGKKFIIQFNRSHTGGGTHLITGATALSRLKRIFPDRPARVVRFINGPIFTINVVVWGKKILFGNPSYQITGLKPFTQNPFATIGNDWGLAREFLTPDKLTQLLAIARDVGEKLKNEGWTGLFGVDAVFNRNRGYLLEINARQPASTSWESLLQEKNSGTDDRISIFAAHLGAAVGVKPEYKLIKIKTGSQIIKRFTGKNLTEVQKQKIVTALPECHIIFYQNQKPESDQIRFQSTDSVMKKPEKLNLLGEKIKKTIT